MFPLREFLCIAISLLPMGVAGQDINYQISENPEWEDDFSGNGLDITKWNDPFTNGNANVNLDGQGNLILVSHDETSSVTISSRSWIRADSGTVLIRVMIPSPDHSRLTLEIRTVSEPDSTLPVFSTYSASVDGLDSMDSDTIVAHEKGPVYYTYEFHWNTKRDAVNKNGLTLVDQRIGQMSSDEPRSILLVLENLDASMGEARAVIDFVKFYR